MIGIRGLDNVREGLGSVDQRARRLQRTLTRTSRTLTRIGSNLTKNLTVPLIAAGGAALKFGADFEDAMTKSLAIMSDVSDEMRDKMEKAAMQVSETTTASATQAAEAYFFLASAGLGAAESIKALPTVAKFAQAGAFDLAKATDLLTDAQSALGLSSEDLARVSDVLVKANTLANASVEQFSESLTNKAGAALRLLGKDVEEGAAVLAVFADQGLKGTASGESLNIVLRDLQTANIKNKKAFKDAGIAVFDSSGEMRNMADIIQDLEKRLLGMTDEQKRSELGLLGFQDKSISATAALLGTSESIRKYEKELRMAGGTTDKVAEKQLKSLTAQAKIIGNRLQNVAIVVSKSLIPIIKDQLLPIIEEWVGKLKTLVDWFNSLPEGVKKTTITITAMLVVIGPLVMFFGKIVMILKTLVPVLALVKKGVLLLNVAMSANPIGAVITLIVALVAATIWLYKNNETFRKAMIATWEAVSYAVQQGASVLKLSFFMILKSALKMVEGIASVFPSLEAKVKKARKAVAEMESAEKQAIITRAKLRKETLLQRNMTDELAESIRKAKESTLELAEAEKRMMMQADGATKTKTLTPEEAEALKERQKRAKELAKERIRLEGEWTRKLAESTATKKQLLEMEYNDALAQAEKLGADVNNIKKFYAGERSRLAEDEKKEVEQLEEQKRINAEKTLADKSRFEAQWTGKLSESILSRKQLLEVERQDALINADKLGADRQDIELYYTIERLKLAKDEADKKDKLDEANAEKKKARIKAGINIAAKAITDIMSMISDSYKEQIRQVDEKKQADIDAVNESTMSEEEKAKAIGEIEEKSAKKTKELKRKQAIADKAVAVFGIVVSTAQAIITALAQLGPIAGGIAAGVIGGIAAAQTAIVLARPVPLAKGGLVKRTAGGVNTIIGEGKEDEMVLPLKTGVLQLADSLYSKFRDMSQNGLGVPELAGFGGRAVENHWYIGTLVADDNGMKELERRQRKFRVEEDQRRGRER
tara:strand:+ start:11997 stop:14990 length:2994 start_codon:yes stop_codon:yes gene_type:complete